MKVQDAVNNSNQTLIQSLKTSITKRTQEAKPLATLKSQATTASASVSREEIRSAEKNSPPPQNNPAKGQMVDFTA